MGRWGEYFSKLFFTISCCQYRQVIFKEHDISGIQSNINYNLKILYYRYTTLLRLDCIYKVRFDYRE